MRLAAGTAEAPGASVVASPRRVRSGLAVAAGALLVALQAALALSHVPWRDETQAWQIAAWSASWSDLLANLRYEGHPALWYGLLRPASAVSTSPFAMAAVQACVASATSGLLLLRAPFPIAHRLALGASYLLLIEYGTVARSYGLGALLVVAILAFRRRAILWFLLALLANVSLHFLLLSAAMVAALALVDGRRSVGGWAVWLTGCAAAALTVRPAPDMVPALSPAGPVLGRVAGLLGEIGTLLVPFDPLAWPAPWPAETPFGLGPMAGALVLAVAFLALRREPRLLLLFAALLGATTALAVLVYPAGLRHVGVLFLFVLAADWLVSEGRGETPTPASRAWAGIAAVFGLLMAAGALAVPFTAGRAVAEWASAQGREGQPWTAVPSYEASLLSAEIGRPVFDLGQGCLTRFTRWNAAATVPRDAEALADRLVSTAATAGRTLYVLAEPGFLPASRPGITTVAAFPAGLSGLPKLVLAVAPPGDGPGGGLPPCPWTKR